MSLPRILLPFALALLVAACFSPPMPPGKSPGAARRALLSAPLELHGRARSMDGPRVARSVTLGDGPRELLWITGGEVRGDHEDAARYLCHARLRFPRASPACGGADEPFAWSRHVAARGLLGFAPGQTSKTFPPGFGYPVFSDEPLEFEAVAMDDLGDAPGPVRFEVAVDARPARDLPAPLRPLFYREVFLENPDPAERIEGRAFHWKLPPGRQVRRADVTAQLALPYATTVHHAGIHVHPFATRLVFRDLATGTTLFESPVRTDPVRREVVAATSYSDAAGFPVHPDHRYELEVTYENPTGETRDAMAVIGLYLANHDLRVPPGSGAS